ncbi:MAG: glutaconate CoA-transferase [Terriglobia bacterium]
MSKFSPADFLVVSMARQIRDRTAVATGVLSWLPMLAIALARATHAPRLTYLNCAGAINPRLRPLPASSTDAALLRRNPYCLRLTDLWEQAAAGRLDLMFFGFAQLDARGESNLSRLAGLNGRARKLPGVAGAFALRQLVAKPVLFCGRHTCRSFVPRVDAVTTVATRKPATVVTDLGVFRLAEGTLEIASLHPTATLNQVEAQTGFPVRRPRRVRPTPPPSPRERRALQELDAKKIRNRYVER